MAWPVRLGVGRWARRVAAGLMPVAGRGWPPSSSGRRARLGFGAAALVAVLLLTGCQVATTVAVRVGPAGNGAVTVTVTFDAAAARAVGGVAGALSVADLQKSGWTVATATGAGGATRVTLTHAVAEVSDVPALLAEVGRSPTGARGPLFTLLLTQTTSAAAVVTTASGEVDLSCGLSCFGDAGLQRDYGSELGVNEATLRTPAGRAAADRDFPFAFDLAVPGRITSSNAAPDGSELHWTPVLGHRILITASATATLPAAKGGPIHVAKVAAAAVGGGSTGAGVAILGAVGIAVVMVVLGLGYRRRLGRRRLVHRLRRRRA
jgi:hypothetical protein